MKVMSKWEAKKVYENWVIIDESRNIINIRDNEANAKLIAAAPEMLELLIYLNNCGGLGFEKHDRIESIIKKITE